MSLSGWGRGTWGEGAWNEALPVVVTGVSGTGAVGILEFSGDVAPAVVNTNILGTGQIGDALAAGGAIVTEEGLVGSIGFGDEQVSAGANVSPTGVTSGSGQIGTVSFSLDCVFAVSGVSCSGAIGTVEVDDLAFGVTGLQATTNIGIVNVWGRVVPDQNANPQEIVPSTTNTWSDITPSSNPNWKEVA